MIIHKFRDRSILKFTKINECEPLCLGVVAFGSWHLHRGDAMKPAC